MSADLAQISSSSNKTSSAPQCPKCGFRVVLDGHRYSWGQDIQLFKCKNKSCRYRFSNGHSSSKTNPKIVRSNQLGVRLEAKKLVSATEIKTVVGDKNDNLITYAWHEKKRGIADTTITHRVFRLTVLMNRGANLDDPESFLSVLMTENFSESSKFQYLQAYLSYAKAFKIPFEKPKIHYEPKVQYTPKPYEVAILIQNLGKQQRALVQTMATTGARIGEMARLEWSEIDSVGQIVYINHPEKGSRARKIHVPEQTIKFLEGLPKTYDPYVFNPNKRTLQATYARSRDSIAKRLDMPILKKIHHHSFRRYFADQTYKKTQFNIRKTQLRMGHKRLSSTEKYFDDFDDENVTFETARAYTVEDAEELRQLGYELYDTGIDENGKAVKLYSRMA